MKSITEIDTNDRHLLAGRRHFGLRGIDVVDSLTLAGAALVVRALSRRF
jgi:hypothetical protein